MNVIFRMLKPILFYVALISTSITIGQTTTLSFEEFMSDFENEIPIPDGAYIQDTNSILDDFQGTYKGSYNNWSYNIKLTKYVKQKTSRGLFEDFVTFEYTITNTVSGESYTNIGESVYDIFKSYRYSNEYAIWIYYDDPIARRAGAILFSRSRKVNNKYGIVFAQNSFIYGNDEEYKEPLIPQDVNVILAKIR